MAIRFTGRVYSKDVGDVLERIVKFNGIEDVARIPVGYRGEDSDVAAAAGVSAGRRSDARGQRSSRSARARKLAVRPRAKGLAGVRVILDAGHGGRDVGTTYDDVWESNVRLRRDVPAQAHPGEEVGSDGVGDDEVEAGRLRRSRRRRAGGGDAITSS